MRFLLLFGLLMATSLSSFSQNSKTGYPGPKEGKLILIVKDFQKAPIKKAGIRIEGIANHTIFEGQTDKAGIWEVIVPNGESYRINIEDSVNYDIVTIPGQASVFTRHTVYFQGSVNGKVTVPSSPAFSMMPPADGMAAIEMHFNGLNNLPLVGEKIWLKGQSSGQEFMAETDAKGDIRIKVPTGDNYAMRVQFNSRFDNFSFPKHGGSYNAKVSYTYAGSAAILNAREQRRINDSIYNAYRALTDEQERKLRDTDAHKTEFRTIPVSANLQTRIRKTDTPYGYHLTMNSPAKMSSPLWLDGKIYAGGGFETRDLHCFDGENGNHLWSVNLGEGGPSTLSGGDGIVVLTTESCTVYALDANTGSLIWSKWLANFVLSAPSVANGKVFIGYRDEVGGRLFNPNNPPSQSMACLDLKTGNIVWQQWIHGEVMSAAVASQNKVWFSTFEGYSYSLDAATGKILQEKQLLATSAPTISGKFMYISQRDGSRDDGYERIAAYDAESFSLVRSTQFRVAPYISSKVQRQSQFYLASQNASLANGFTGDVAQNTEYGSERLVGVSSIFSIQSFQGSRVLARDGFLYASMGNALICLNAATMGVEWERKIADDDKMEGGFLLSPPVFAGEDVVVACLDGGVRVFGGKGGNLKKNYSTGEQFRVPPIVMNGTIYATSTRGKIVAVKTDNASYTGWQCWGGNLARTNEVGK